MPTKTRPARPGGYGPLILVSVAVHAAAIGGLAVRPDAWLTVIAVLVLNHAAITLAVMMPRSAWLGTNLRRLPESDAAQFALTFDDGPDPITTRDVLDLLAANGMTATFFCVGSQALKHPELMDEIRARGHAIGNHTFSHPHLFALSGPGTLRREVARAQQALTSSAGAAPAFFRAPAGFRSPWLAPILAEAGLHYVSWTRRGFDTVTADGSVVAERLIRNLRAGDILVLHDRGSAVDATGRPVVIAALTIVVRRARELGLVSRGLTAEPRSP
jgi:peptidoglycan/xylan/chitin deacetylase (PgdA/CDA1 family)